VFNPLWVILDIHIVNYGHSGGADEEVLQHHER